MSATTTARLAALEARVSQLETINSRLIDVAARLMSMIDERTLFAVEELAERDSEAAATTAELATAIRSRAPRGFKIPITVHEYIYKSPEDREAFLSWIVALNNIERRGWKLETILAAKGIINSAEREELTIPHRLAGDM
jgi:hypothetical protein